MVSLHPVLDHHARLNDSDYVAHLIKDWLEVQLTFGSVPDTSIFQALDETHPGSNNWKIYFHDVPLSALVDYVNCAYENATNPALANYDTSDYGPGSRGSTFAEDANRWE